MKRGIKDCNIWDVWEKFTHGFHTSNIVGIVAVFRIEKVVREIFVYFNAKHLLARRMGQGTH